MFNDNWDKYHGSHFDYERFRKNMFKQNMTPLQESIADFFSIVPSIPAYEITDWTIRVAVPGLTKSDLKVVLKATELTLTISHDKKEKLCPVFTRTFAISNNVDLEKISVLCENGILTVDLPWLPVRPKPFDGEKVLEVK